MKIIISILIIMNLNLLSQTSGPKQPEFSNFGGVPQDGFVNEFDGSFNYSIDIFEVPGPEGTSFPIRLSYASGVKPDEEASWVGLGWILNNGSIVRNVRGYPDDYNGDKVRFINKKKPIYNLSFGITPSPEFFSFDNEYLPNILLLNYTIQYNSQTGFNKTWNLGWSAKLSQNLSLNLNYSISNGGNAFGYDVIANIGDIFNKNEINRTDQNSNKMFDINSLTNSLQSIANSKKLNPASSNYSIGSSAFNYPSINLSSYVSAYIQGSYDVRIDGFPHLGAKLKLTGSIGIHNFTNSDISKPTYGYMYSGNSEESENGMMDYYSEGNQPLQEKEKYLNIPFANSDQFVVMGAGLSGGFKLFQKNVGSFKPNKINSIMLNAKGGFSTGFGLFNLGFGYDLGLGAQIYELNGIADGIKKYNSFTKQNVMFRFNNDKAGSIQITDDIHDLPIASQSNYLLYNTINLNNVYNKMTAPFDVNSSSNIKFNLIKEHKQGFSEYLSSNDYTKPTGLTQDVNLKTNYYNAYKNDDVRQEESQSEGDELDSRIRNFEITNKDGLIYTFGLPIYSRKERNFNYLLNNTKPDSENLVFSDIDVNTADYVTGTEQNPPYASTYLLTSITGQNYIDRLNDGPSYDDIGGWVRFKYEKTTTSNNLYDSLDSREGTQSYYKWRIPYYGMNFQLNSISDIDDNMGSVLSGEKEIYFLDTIETKTHIAIFHKSPREDAYQALPFSESELNDMTKTELQYYINTNRSYLLDSARMMKLDSIRLFFKNNSLDSEDWILQKVANFEYDYSLCGNVINNIGTSVEKGKLTLKKMWIENFDVKEHLINPYMFEYEHPNYTTKPYPSKYVSLKVTSTADENPEYNPDNIDAWGFYQIDNPDGKSRKAQLKNFVNQQPPTDFDPSAWNLKQVRLPSGGEIHIQYEQNEYLHVQDQRAMQYTEVDEYYDGIGGAIFTINFEDIISGGGTTQQQDEILKLYKEIFLTKKELINYKLLWNLMSFGSKEADVDNCKSEYLDGFVQVIDITKDASSIYIKIKSDNNNIGLPRRSCIEYVNSQKIGKIDIFNNCKANSNLNPATTQLTEFLSTFMTSVMSILDLDNITICSNLNENGLSYLRLPSYTPKKGGGIRVKRVLFYDKFNKYWRESEPVLYGKEYLYIDKEGNSSGVASNEPFSIGDENSLYKGVNKDLSFNGLITGKMKDQNKFPFSTSILPSSQVGYSSIITKNIYEGKSEVGFKISEYITTKDYPITYKYEDNSSGLYASEVQNETSMIILPLIFFNYMYTKKIQSQSFRLIKNQMNGQKKREANYSGIYSDKDSWVVSNFTEYEYYNPGQKIPIFNKYSDINFDYLGSESELFMESKDLSDMGAFVKGNIDFSLVFIPLFILSPISTVSMGVESINSQLSSHVINKVVSHPTYLKSITNYKDGKKSIVENVAFDKNTGEVALKRYYDGHNDLDLDQSSDHKGAYHEYNFYGSNYYDLLQVKSKDENVLYKHEDLKTYRLIEGSDVFVKFDTQNKNPEECINLSMFSSGDVIRLTNGFISYDNEDGLIGYYQIKEVHNTKLEVIPLFESTEYKFETTSELITAVNIEITEASELNNVNAQVGQIVTYGEGLELVNGELLPEMNYTETITSEMTNEIEEREAFVDALNNFICAAMSSTVNLSDYYTGTITLSNEDGDCETLNTSAVSSSFNFESEVYKVCISYGDPQTFTSSSTFHPLVNDLNNWLDKVWSTRLDREVLLDYDWSVCYFDDSENTDVDEDQKYVNQAQLQFPNNFNIGESMRNITGMTKIEKTKYFINGHYLKGKQIIEHLWAGTHWNQQYYFGDIQTYFAKRHSDTEYEAYISSSYFQFADELSSYTTVAYNDIMGILRQLDRYGDYCNPIEDDPTDLQLLNGIWNTSGCRRYNDCANYNDHISAYLQKKKEVHPEGNGNQSDWYKGFIDLPTLSGYQEYDAASSASLTIDITNNQMWEDMGYGDYNGSPTITFTEDIGKFYVNESDGYLYYERIGDFYDTEEPSGTINSLDDKIYGYGADVRMFQIMPAGGYTFTISNECCLEFNYNDIVDNGSSTIVNYKDYFYVDANDGYKIKINYDETMKKANPCSDENFCLSVCDDLVPLKTIPNVISANASSFTDSWQHELSDYNYEELNPLYPNEYKSGNKGKLKNSENFVYNTDIIQARGVSNERIYSEAGVYEEFDLYNWRNIASNSNKWLSQSKITKYSPNGNVLEAKNPLDIYSSSKYNKNNQLVTIVANNAEEFSYDFESFEEVTYFSISASITNAHAHSGKKSAWITNQQKIVLGNKIIINQQIKDEGLILFLWVKAGYLHTYPEIDYIKSFIEFYFGSTSMVTSIIPGLPEIVAQTGEWSLYVEELSTAQLAPYALGTELYIGVKSTRGGPSEDVWIDDYKAQPTNSNLNCYVYDIGNYQLMASFDDQHFGMYYDYNDEGQLVRKRIETERGMKTITEQQYNTLSVKRDQSLDEIDDYIEDIPGMPFNRINYLDKLNRFNPNLKLENVKENKSTFELFNFELSKDTLLINYPKFNSEDFKLDSNTIEKVKSNSETYKNLKNLRNELKKERIIDSVLINTMNLDSLKNIKDIEMDSLGIDKEFIKSQIDKNTNKNIEVNKSIKK